jgi:hypothetical protein
MIFGTFICLLPDRKGAFAATGITSGAAVKLAETAGKSI